jgi:basic membrane protein A
VVTSMIKRGDVAVFDTIRAVTEKRFTGGLTSFGLAEDGVGYVDEGPHAAAIPDDVKKRVAVLAGRVVKGEIKVPDQL